MIEEEFVVAFSLDGKYASMPLEWFKTIDEARKEAMRLTSCGNKEKREIIEDRRSGRSVFHVDGSRRKFWMAIAISRNS